MPKRSLPSFCIVGENVVIDEGVMIGENVRIGHHSVLLKGTVVEEDVVIGNHAVLGCQPFKNARIQHESIPNHPLFIG